MKKVRAFFIAATLILATVGAIAGSKKFATAPNLYFYRAATGYIQVQDQPFLGTLQYNPSTTAGTAATATYSSITYSLWIDVSGTKYPAYF
jgi:hypothetical protein